MTRHNHIRLLIISMLMMIAVLAGGCSSSPSPSAVPPATQAGGTGQDLTVHYIDVGQGDSILAESDGHYMLIDAGENDQADTVVSYLKQAGVTTLDYVIGTHPHSDHIGGLDKVIEEFTVGKVILPPVEHTTRTFEDVLNAVSNKGLKITKPVPGDTYGLGNASFTIVAPVKDYGNDLNNWSVGIRLTYGSNSFLMCGDAESQAESDMLDSGIPLKADVLKAGHHGSSTSTSSTFLKAVSPSYVVIQCGKDNSYGHPHKETMEKLEKAGCRIFRTDEDGTITASSDGTHITWDVPGTQKDAGAQPSPAQQSTYILNTNTMKFHLPGCPSSEQIQDRNRKEYTGTRDGLISQGYAPCKQCNP